MGKPAQWLLHVRAEPDKTGGDPDGTRRLRSFLKNMLRTWRLRCIAITTPAGEDVPLQERSGGQPEHHSAKGGQR